MADSEAGKLKEYGYPSVKPHAPPEIITCDDQIPTATVVDPSDSLARKSRNVTVNIGVKVLAIVVLISSICAITVPMKSNGSKSVPSPKPTSEQMIPSQGETNAEKVIVVHSHNTKELWMDEIANKFNNGVFTFVDSSGVDRQLCVKICHRGAALRERPCDDNSLATMWSPPNAIWVERNYLHDPYNSYVSNPEECKKTTNVPIGIAMWREMAETLGWPGRDLGWDDILNLAMDSNGWASVEGANPIKWGTKFLYGHGHPELSNSGSLSWVSTVHNFANVSYQNQPTEVDIYHSEVVRKSKALANAVSHMGKIDTDILDRMVIRGEAYLHAVANYESNVIRYNSILKQERGEDDQLVMIYPNEGTFWMEHPVCVLDGPGAHWISEDDVAAAQVFADFISSEENQRRLCKYGIRPFSVAAQQSYSCTGDDQPFTLDNGVIPGKEVPHIIHPLPETVNAIVDMWKSIRKPVKWTLVLDRSGSMINDNKISLLRQAAKGFVDKMSDRDHVSIVAFNSYVMELLPMEELEDNRADILSSLLKLSPSGNTLLRPAVEQALSDLKQTMESDTDDYNYGMMVLTDGMDTSEVDVSTVYSILPEGSFSDEIHIFSIALMSNTDGIGKEDLDFLDHISSQTNGKLFLVDDENDLELTFGLIQAEL